MTFQPNDRDDHAKWNEQEPEDVIGLTSPEVVADVIQTNKNTKTKFSLYYRGISKTTSK